MTFLNRKGDLISLKVNKYSDAWEKEDTKEIKGREIGSKNVCNH